MNRFRRMMVASRRPKPKAARRAEPPFWVTLIVYVVLFVVSELLRPKPELENAKPAGLGDFRFPTATEGRAVPILWGKSRIEGPNVVWYGDLRQEAITEKIKTGLFSSEKVTKGFQYKIGIQFAFCTGPGVELTRAWIGDDLVLDAVATPIEDGDTFTIDEPELFGGEDLGSGGVVGTLEFFGGTNTQAVSGYLSASSVLSAVVAAGGAGYTQGDILTVSGGTLLGGSSAARFRVETLGGSDSVATISLLEPSRYSVAPTNPVSTTVAPFGGSGCTLTLTFGDPLQHEQGDTPAYHDICMALPFEAPTYIGNNDSLKAWKWELGRFPNGLALTGGDERVAGGANPMNVIYEILTSTDWGYGEPPADIDTSNFTAAATTLANEGNGFAFLLDRQVDIGELLRQVEEQIDGILDKDETDGLWKIKLIRADYDINTVPELNATNIIEIQTFTRATYESTTNNVRVPFNQADDEYKDTYGFAQDMAGVRILGSNVTTSVTIPGCKDKDLANAIAWRKLRTLAIPLSQATVIVDRTLYALKPGDAVGLTDADLGFVRLPMRVKSIDLGEMLDGRISLDLVQDVFFAAAGVFDPNPSTGWTPPADALIAFPSPYQVAFEAPLMLTRLDPDPEATVFTDKIYAAARRVGPEAVFDIVERNAAGAPAGAFTKIGDVFQFQLIGQLDLALGLTTGATVTFSVTPEPDTQAAILNAFPTITNLVELGSELISLIYIETADGEGEFMLVTSAQTSVGNVQLNNVYRGIGDSVQRSHSAAANVYLIFVGSGMSTGVVPAGNNVDVKLLPRSASDTLAEASAVEIAFTMGNRTRLPYPPSRFDLNGTTLDETNVDLDGSGSGEDVGVLVDDIRRRDFRTLDEIGELGQDAATIHADFPAANSTEVEVEVRDGVTVLATTTAIVGTSTTMRQLDILAGLDTTTLPASLTFAVRQSHTFEGTVYKSRVWLEVTATIVSPLIGRHAFGELDQNEEGAVYLVQSGDDSTDHVFNLSTAFTVGDVEYELDNSGSWITLIAAGGTGPGTIPNASLSVGTEIRVRHLSTDTSPQKLLTMTVSGTEEAYAVLIS